MEKKISLDAVERLIKVAYKEGWRQGYWEGGEHDCRMFKPTAENAWEDHQADVLRKLLGRERG